jgi:hypothetical protein
LLSSIPYGGTQDMTSRAADPAAKRYSTPETGELGNGKT